MARPPRTTGRTSGTILFISIRRITHSSKATEMVVDELVVMRQEIGRVFPPRDRERESDRRGTDAAGK